MRDVVRVDQRVDEVSGETIVAGATRGRTGGGKKLVGRRRRFSLDLPYARVLTIRSRSPNEREICLGAIVFLHFATLDRKLARE